MIPVVGMKPVVLAQWFAMLSFTPEVSGSTPHGITRYSHKYTGQDRDFGCNPVECES
jgi:hypothetical protein